MDGQNDVRVTFRVDRELKERAESLLGQLGMNMTTALNVFLRKVVDEEAIPFVIASKKSTFGRNYSALDISKIFETAVSKELVDKKDKGTPIASYDSSKKKAYIEFADGTREYIDE